MRVRVWSLPAAPSLSRPPPAGRVASFSMPGSPSRYSLGPSLRGGHEVGERVQSNEMGTSVLIMQPILRFLQLLCENHNRDLQVCAGPAPTPLASAWIPTLAACPQATALYLHRAGPPKPGL